MNSGVYTLGTNQHYVGQVLYDRFAEKGCELATIDMYPLDEFDAFIFSDFPTKEKRLLRAIRQLGKPMYLIINEYEGSKPDNWYKKNHSYFKKIFTWAPRYVDNEKYYPIRYPVASLKLINATSGINVETKKICCAIWSNKRSNHKNELYSERIKVIRWFEKNAVADFCLYGYGWDQIYLPGPFWRLRKIPLVSKMTYRISYSCYQGKVDSTVEIYGRYKFAFAYENCKDTPGCISERIFDSLVNMCIPIYLGDPDVADYIPTNTFIDKRKFDNYQQLYDYLKFMLDPEYEQYLHNIHSFLNSPLIYPFTAEAFADTLISHVC